MPLCHHHHHHHLIALVNRCVSISDLDSSSSLIVFQSPPSSLICEIQLFLERLGGRCQLASGLSQPRPMKMSAASAAPVLGELSVFK